MVITYFKLSTLNSFGIVPAAQLEVRSPLPPRQSADSSLQLNTSTLLDLLTLFIVNIINRQYVGFISFAKWVVSLKWTH